MAVALSGCASPYMVTAAGPAAPATLGDIISSSATGNRPSGDFYVALTASPDNAVRIQDQQCVDRSFWSFARRFIGVSKSAAAMLTAKITPTTDPAQAITIPIFLTSANEIDGAGPGSNCQTKFWARPITFTFNSNLNPAFNVDLEFHLTHALNSAALGKLVDKAQMLMTLVGTASATPSALAVKLADPQIKSLAASIDNQIRDEWTSSSDLQITKQLTTGSDGGAIVDLIRFRMPAPDIGPGMFPGGWNAGGTISLVYSQARFKSGGKWVDKDTVLVMPIVPSGVQGAATTLDRIVLNGDVTNGFDKLSLINASNVDSLSNACNHLKKFLSSFLIPDDALVARYALLRESSYDKNPNLREQSECLSEKESDALLAMRADFTFSEQPRGDRDNATVEQRMQPIRAALLSKNPVLIGASVTEANTKFYAVLGAAKADYFVGDDAIARLSEVQMKLLCYQARPNHDLSSIAAVAAYGGRKTGAIVSFDARDKLASVTLMAPNDVADALEIDKSKWLNPGNVNCAVDGAGA